MKPPGAFKVSARRSTFDPITDPLAYGQGRVQRIVDSLRSQIVEGGPEQQIRIRMIFQSPREIYRIELENPALSYQRTTLLDRDALDELLEVDEVRALLPR